MRIEASDRLAYVELALSGAEGGPMPAVALAVEVAAERSGTRFFGADHSVWVVGPKLRQFVAKLADLECQRSGVATLTSMSPGELTLEVRVVDAAGHVVLSASVRRRLRVCERLHEHAGAIAFELDPTSLPKLVGDARSLVAQFEERIKARDRTQPAPRTEDERAGFHNFGGARDAVSRR